MVWTNILLEVIALGLGFLIYELFFDDEMETTEMDFLAEIVDKEFSSLTKEDKEVLAACEPFCGKYGIEFHMTAGLQLRNKYKLWEHGNGDDLSAAILDKLIRRVKENETT